MVVGNFHIMRFTIVPTKAKSPLVVDSNAMLSGAIANEPFQVVARRNQQVIQRLRGVKHRKLAKSSPLQLTGKSLDSLAPKEPFGVLVGEAADHVTIVAHRVTIGKSKMAMLRRCPGRNSSLDQQSPSPHTVTSAFSTHESL